MQKKYKYIIGISCLLLILFFLGACGKKEDTAEKPKVVSKKIISKKVSKPPVPQKVEKSETDAPPLEKAEVGSKEAVKAVKPEATTEKADDNGKKVISTTALADKKKPAFKPKSEISAESDYAKISAPGLQVAKKQDKQPSDLITESAPAKDSLTTTDKGKIQELKEQDLEEPKTTEKVDKTAKKDDLAESKKDVPASESGRKDMVSTPPAKENEESSLIEENESEEKQVESESIAKLTPSQTLDRVQIEPLTKDFKYKSEGKIDPFSSLFKVKEEAQKKKRKRFPLTPLEKVDISQFKLVGVILSAKGSKAIVQEASGKGYVVSKGTYIGVNDGRVVEILKDSIICEEKVEDLFGQIETKSRILKINKPAEAL